MGYLKSEPVNISQATGGCGASALSTLRQIKTCQNLRGNPLVCQPTSHPMTYEWVEFLARSGAVWTVVRTRWTGHQREIDTYRYAQSVPLRDHAAILILA